MSETVIEHIGDDFPVTVRYEVKSSAVEFFASRVVAVSETEKVYERAGATASLDDTSDFNEAARYVSGLVKWDGCSHFTFGDEDAYLHLCGGAEIQKLATTLTAIYERCGELMKANGTNLSPGEFECTPNE